MHIPIPEPESFREFNPCHAAGSGEFCSDGGVPPEPGTTPIPPGMIRGYHYTTALDAVLTSGLSITKARGNTYGEPNAIWFSTTKPSDFKNYVEVHLRPEEVGLGGPSKNPTQAQIDTFNTAGGNFMARLREIPASRFATYHRPWHSKFHALMEDYPPDNLESWNEKRMSGYGGHLGVVTSFEKINDPEYTPAVREWAKRVRAALK